jgi:hypothetical protein
MNTSSNGVPDRSVWSPRNESQSRRLLSFWGLCGQIGLTVLLLGFVLICVEVGTRLVAKVPPTTEGVVLDNAAYAYHPWSAHRMTPGFRSGNLSINKYGWRGPEPSKTKAPGVKRVLLLGDSVAFSSFYIKDDVTIAGYLEAILKMKSGERWEVINLATPGGNGRMSLATLAHEAIHLQPDFVVVLNGANDLPILLGAGDVGAPPFTTVPWDGTSITMSHLFDPRTGRSPLPTQNLMVLLNESVFFRQFARSWLMGIAPQTRWPSTFAHPDRLDSFIESQVAMHYLAKGAGATFIHFIQPYLSQTHKQIGATERESMTNAVKQWGPGLFEFYDAAFAVLRTKMAEASRRHGFRAVDLSLLFTMEDVFLDQVHVDAHVTSSSEHPANCKVALHMAAEIFATSGRPTATGERCEGQMLSREVRHDG